MEYYTEAQAKEFAKEASKSIVVKNPCYDFGQKEETRRNTTPAESMLLENIILGALLAIRGNIGNDNKFVRSGHISGAKNTAEFIGDLLFGWNINGYLTVYCPICDFLRDYDA